ncbi:hypothetical protein SISSUDRAFT_1132585 [Sistotremastrum suecicum HHB10207 ss-3]|uniref:RNase III domain-containing protein n=1 Tax=Sistotremastrum suecicum HHB10207 ss-3 TaxID=1314776 RepID=A0A165YLN7_9AGAM|nr:hypothetical protein SISSUDRAFT_1132585 [Sistotremastrum suecicum HHB10207 ss-3]
MHPLRRKRSNLQRTASSSSPSTQPPPPPPLPSPLLEIVNNCCVGTPGNNDFLELIGDRCVGVLAADITGRRYVRNQRRQRLARAALCTNDLLGRLTHTLSLHTTASFPPPTHALISAYSPTSSQHPPKPLADLFESYIGAIYKIQGLVGVYAWLYKYFDWLEVDVWDDLNEKLGRDADYGGEGERWNDPVFVDNTNYDPARHLFLPRDKSKESSELDQSWISSFIRHTRHSISSSSSALFTRVDLLDYEKFSFDGVLLREPHSMKLEMGECLLNFWIVDVMMDEWPWYEYSISGAPHLATLITRIIRSTTVLASLARAIKLSQYIPPSNCEDICLAQAFVAFLGRFYENLHGVNDDVLEEGREFLRGIVRECHDLVIRNKRNLPIMPESCLPPKWAHHATQIRSDSTTIEHVIRRVQSMSLSGSRQRVSSFSSPTPHPNFHPSPSPMQNPNGPQIYQHRLTRKESQEVLDKLDEVLKRFDDTLQSSAQASPSPSPSRAPSPSPSLKSLKTPSPPRSNATISNSEKKIAPVVSSSTPKTKTIEEICKSSPLSTPVKSSAAAQSSPLSSSKSPLTGPSGLKPKASNSKLSTSMGKAMDKIIAPFKIPHLPSKSSSPSSPSSSSSPTSSSDSHADTKKAQTPEFKLDTVKNSKKKDISWSNLKKGFSGGFKVPELPSRKKIPDTHLDSGSESVKGGLLPGLNKFVKRSGESAMGGIGMWKSVSVVDLREKSHY